MDIKELRKARNLTQSELAKLLEVSAGAIGHLENGRMKISDKLAAKVKDVFGEDIEIPADVVAAGAAVEKAVKKAVKEANPDVEKTVKAVKKAVKEANPDVEKAVKAVKAAVKESAKPAAKAGKPAKAPAKEAKETKPEIYVQSPMGGNITPEEIVKKLPKGVESVFVRVDQNKLWWIRGEETGSVDIW